METPFKSIEAIWSPINKKEEEEEKPSLQQASTGSITAASNGEKSLNGGAGGGPSRLRHMLAALSFESRSNDSLRQQQKRKHRKKKRKPKKLVIETEAHLDYVIMDSEGSDIYLDADDFEGRIHESIVVAGITVDNHHEEESEAVETVLNGSVQGESSSGSEEYEYSENGFSEDSDHSSPTSDSNSSIEMTSEERQGPPLSPRPPAQLPLRFLRAGKNDPVEGLRRYKATLQWRKEEKIDTILREPSPEFDLIKQHYPHYCHLTGKNGEPCYYEQPPRTDLRALRAGGVTLEKLLRHYTQITEFQWQYLQRDDLATSIYVIDLEGIRLGDFVGEAVDFVKKASMFSAQHYPERAGFVFVINVPVWFKVIWNVIRPIVDEDTLKKVYILRGKEEIRENMQERIPLENIPPEYGGKSMPLGEAPEEKTLAELIAHNNTLAEKGQKVCSCEDCKFCNWAPARSY